MKKWYEKGVSFSCAQCGKCCMGSGDLFLSIFDLKRLAFFFKLSIQEFSQKYTYTRNDRILVKEALVTKDCIFLENKRCSVYEARPTQCRTFPWWPDYIQTKLGYENLTKSCKGAHRETPSLVSSEVIEATSLEHLKNFSCSLISDLTTLKEESSE